MNLLTNAAKYTDEGGRIWLSVEHEGDTAVLRVRDTGIGPSPDTSRVMLGFSDLRAILSISSM